jgi:hypothetical protein
MSAFFAALGGRADIERIAGKFVALAPFASAAGVVVSNALTGG